MDSVVFSFVWIVPILSEITKEGAIIFIKERCD
jgi:hypothetical protein